MTRPTRDSSLQPLLPFKSSFAPSKPKPGSRLRSDRRPSWPSSEEQRNNEENEKKDKKNLRNPSGSPGDPPETKNAGKDRYH
jgi:anti-sigma-K factor RskA